MHEQPRAIEATRAVVTVGPAELATATWGGGPPEIVMLHDGLGSISQWRSVPSSIAESSGKTVMAYDRSGHGASTPTPVGPWPADWLHREAAVLGQLLEAVEAPNPLLVGHSDGGSIALIHAASGGAGRGLVSLAAHAWVEQITVDAIEAMRSNTGAVVSALGRHHDDPAAIFEAWSGVWVGEEFASWDIRPSLGEIDMPVLAVQGDADEYATDAHVEAIASAVGANARAMLVPGARHLMHHGDPELVAAVVLDALALDGPVERR